MCSWVGKDDTDCFKLCLWVGKHAETVSDCVYVLVNMALGLFQILFMVGKGYLRPDITRCRSDTPKQFKRILQDCVHFAREDRPLFPQVSLVIMNCCFLSLLLAFHFSEVDLSLKSFGKTAFLTKVWAFQFLIMMISRQSAEGGLGERKT